MSKVAPHPSSYLGRIKMARRYCSQMPLSSGDARLLRGTLLELIDALLLAAGDNDVAEELVRAAQPTVSPTPMHYPPAGVQHIPTVTHVTPMNQPVVITEAHETPSHLNPQIIVRPSDAAPDVFMADGIPTQSLGLPPGFAALPAGTPIPSTGHVKMVRPGEDPIKAMDDNMPEPA